ncbi:hypothetical protein MBOURGENBZM_14800 [Methanoculleus bourgensis]|nr:hypothetical protein MBOURGENBZM_14800 [Methanoculleus bourgensis]
MKAIIDRSGCIRCGSASSEITERYRVSDNHAEGEEDLADCAVEAADSCPVTVIFVEG